MLFIFRSIRVSRNACLPSFKLAISTYSDEAVSSVKEFCRTQRRRCASDATRARRRVISSSLIGSAEQRNSPVTPVVAVTDDENRREPCGGNGEEEWRHIKLDSDKLRKHCFMLSKIRLTSLVVVTTMAGYVIAPGHFDVSTFAACSVGTGLLSSTANAINQFFEVPFDAQMSRTKNRVLVRGHLTPGHAIMFAIMSGTSGLLLLYSQVNGLTAALGATNLILYTLIYTPMKRVSILNTWVGSIVGAIPPLMGWAACVGDILSPGAWIMSGLLYAWQFPHFNALSWNLRPDYSRAGYRMMAVTDPKLCRRTALRYTAALMGICYLAPVFNVTTWWFAIASTPLNAYFLYLAWKFHRRSDSKSSRKLFHVSLIHLPVLMVLILVNKKHWYRNDEHDSDEMLVQEKEKDRKKEKGNDSFAIITKLIAST